MLPAHIAELFERQARAGEDLGSPFTAVLCRTLAGVVDDGTATGRRIIGWQGDVRAALVVTRLCGGLHRLVLSGMDDDLCAAYPPNSVSDAELAGALARAIERHDGLLHDWLDSAPQTNEIARSAMLLPGFLAIARESGLPLTLCEIGSSAGLNLLFDRFSYSYGDAHWGDRDSPVHLAPQIKGNVPPLDGVLTVRSRWGCDIAPVKISSEEGRMRLRSYVWPDQPERLQRLDGALALAEQHPVAVAKADAGEFVRAKLAQRSAGEAFVVFHSIMWQYMPRQTKDEILAALSEAGREASTAAPLYRLRMEPRDPQDGWATLSLTTWPGGETRRLAKCDFHGRWIEWLG